MNFKITVNLDLYKPVKLTNSIELVDVLDKKLIQDELDYFNQECIDKNGFPWKEIWSVEDAIQWLDRGWLFFLCKDNDILIGWSWVDIPNKKFCHNYVSKNYRNKGCGRELTYVRLNECKKRGIDKIKVRVDGWNMNALHIYLNLDYVTIEKGDFYHDF